MGGARRVVGREEREDEEVIVTGFAVCLRELSERSSEISWDW
jgi:hypothetical protein